MGPQHHPLVPNVENPLYIPPLCILLPLSLQRACSLPPEGSPHGEGISALMAAGGGLDSVTPEDPRLGAETGTGTNRFCVDSSGRLWNGPASVSLLVPSQM